MAVKCKELIYTPINAISFRISGGTHLLTPNIEKKIIKSLESPDGPIFTLGTTVEIKNRKYKVNIIKELIINNRKQYTISIAKRTKSSMFIMPMLGGHRELFFWNKLFVNCFIATEKDEDCIALLYRWSSDPLYVKFEKALSKFRTFKRRYDPNSNYVMFVFDIPKKHVRNYKKFIKGQYSRFSQNYKLDVLDFHDKDFNDDLGQILFKSEKRRLSMEHKLDVKLPKHSELLSIININEETYNPTIYKFKKLI